MWRETPSTTLDVEPWRILATTLGSGTVRVVALSSSLTGDDDVPPPPGVQVLATDGVTAWWTAPYLDPTGYRGVATRVVGASVKSEKATPVVVADHAYLPVVAGGQVVVLRSLVSDRASGGRFAFLAPLDGGGRVVHSGTLGEREAIWSACGSPRFLVYVISSGDLVNPGQPSEMAVESAQLHIRELSTGAETLIALQDSGKSLSLSCSDTLVAWGNGSSNGDPGQYVYDLHRHELYRLGEAAGRSVVFVADSVIAWSNAPADPLAPTEYTIARWGTVNS